MKLDNRLSLGGDFAAMFMGAGNRKSAMLDAENRRAESVSPAVSSCHAKQLRRGLTLMQDGPNQSARQPAIARKPLGNVSNERSLTGDISASPWGAQKAAEKQRLMFSTSPGPSPTGTPPIPEYEDNANNTKRSDGFSNGGLRRSSAMRRQSLKAASPEEDEDARLMRESISAMRRLNVEEAPRARESWINPSAMSSYTGAVSTPRPTAPSSNNTTPRARYPAAEPEEESLFDAHTATTASLAMQWGEKPATPVSTAPKNKVMTTEQFERYRQDQEYRKKRASGAFNNAVAQESDDDAADDTYEDEEDHEEERRREQLNQRRKQEAHMTIYRQQMMKITGEAPNPIARPSAVSSQSAPNILLYSDNPAADDDEDEDIPLAILAAHGFPNRNRAPGQLQGMSSNPNLRAASQMSAYPPPPRSVSGNPGDRGSALPPFARRLPQDPYFGAGLVNSTNRESLALGSGSQYGGAPRAQPGGLVGVIANEERSRAMRRGSPNPQGEYPGMPGMSIGLGYAGGSRTPGGQPFPTDPAAMQAQMAAMQLQLQQSMEMQFQFFQMMAGQAPGMVPPQGMQPGMMPPQGMQPGMMMPQGMPAQNRTSTMGSGMGFNGFPSGPRSVVGGSQRHTVMAVGGATGAGYAPSIAPSERSNVGMPDRYRPVSSLPAMNGADTGSLRMGGLNSMKTPVVHVQIAEAEKEEDEEVAWEEMRKQKEKKKSIWRMKKEKKVELDDIGEMARFTN